MFVIPDGILEELTCNFCHKYLSVGPVKIDANRRKKCGRCALDENQIEVTSVYQFFGENAVFKCINRFDGCEEMLTYSEVINHEEECSGNKYECPICEDGVEIKTYELVYHFKKQHNQNYLKKSILKRKLDEIQTVNKFLYLKGNFIFIIFIEFEQYSQTLSFNAFHIGGRNAVYDIQQKYYVHVDGLKLYETNKWKSPLWQNTVDVNWKKNSKKMYDYDQNDCYVVIHFEFNVPVKVPLSNKTKTGPTISKNVRYIHVDKDVEKLLKTVSISPCRKKLIFMTFDEELEIEIDCKVCSNLSPNNLSHMTANEKPRQLICSVCIMIESTNTTNLREILTTDDIIRIRQCFEYSCKWNCGILNNLEQVEIHELSCEQNPGIKCPYKNCFFHGVYEKMNMHFKEEHNAFLSYKFLYAFSADMKQYKAANDIILPTGSFLEHYIMTGNNVLLKCRFTRTVDNAIIIQVKSVDKLNHIGNIQGLVQETSVFRDKSKKDDGILEHFVNRSNKIISFPFKLLFMIN